METTTFHLSMVCTTCVNRYNVVALEAEEKAIKRTEQLASRMKSDNHLAEKTSDASPPHHITGHNNRSNAGGNPFCPTNVHSPLTTPRLYTSMIQL